MKSDIILIITIIVCVLSWVFLKNTLVWLICIVSTWMALIAYWLQRKKEKLTKRTYL